MKRTNLLAVMVVLAVITVFAASASAYYHPTLGRWVSRDPGPGAGRPIHVGAAGPAVGGGFAKRDPVGKQYADGMSLYQYVQSKPVSFLDPSGLFRRYDGCTAAEEAALRRDETRALSQVATLKAQINAALAADKGQYPPFTGAMLRRALWYLDQPAIVFRDYKVRCCLSPQDRLKYCKGSAYAWVKWIFARTVYICPDYFTPGSAGPKTRAAILVHEATHTRGTNDIRYFWQNGQWPHRVGIFGWDDIASTYDTWILARFCIPGHNCGGPINVNTSL